VQWKTSESEGVVAELWSALPQIAAPRPSVAIPPAPVVVAKPPPAPAPEPVKSPRVDAQIAVEQAKRQEAERLEAARQAEAARREQARRDDAERQRLADEQAQKTKLAEKARQDAAQQAAIRQANLRRMMSQAGSSDDPAAVGTAARTSGPSASYAGRIKARIKPNIVLTGNVDGNPLATVEVRLAPDGTIVGRKLTKSSGQPVWDETVLRAIDKTEKLPQDTDGRVPASMSIDFRPQE
jgi:colicin import membrane protein